MHAGQGSHAHGTWLLCTRGVAPRHTGQEQGGLSRKGPRTETLGQGAPVRRRPESRPALGRNGLALVPNPGGPGRMRPACWALPPSHTLCCWFLSSGRLTGRGAGNQEARGSPGALSPSPLTRPELPGPGCAPFLCSLSPECSGPHEGAVVKTKMQLMEKQRHPEGVREDDTSW